VGGIAVSSGNRVGSGMSVGVASAVNVGVMLVGVIVVVAPLGAGTVGS
jgi:hypothetical protein